MAENQPPKAAAEQPLFCVVVDAQRHRLAYKAAATIGAIAGPLQFLTCDTGDQEADAAHQLAIRIQDLAGVILSALSDEIADFDAEQYRLLGPEMYRRMRTEAANG